MKKIIYLVLAISITQQAFAENECKDPFLARTIDFLSKQKNSTEQKLNERADLREGLYNTWDNETVVSRIFTPYRMIAIGVTGEWISNNAAPVSLPGDAYLKIGELVALSTLDQMDSRKIEEAIQKEFAVRAEKNKKRAAYLQVYLNQQMPEKDRWYSYGADGAKAASAQFFANLDTYDMLRQQHGRAEGLHENLKVLCKARTKERALATVQSVLSKTKLSPEKTQEVNQALDTLETNPKSSKAN